MFTGLIQEIGEVKKAERTSYGMRVKIFSPQIAKDLNKGDSVAVNGVCLTAADIDKDTVVFDAVKNTLKQTGQKRLRAGDPVNMEGAAKVGDKIGGHIVSGHVEGERTVRKNAKTSDGWILEVNMESGDEKYLVAKGSVAIDGVSLTVSDVHSGFFRAFLIPVTIEKTILKLKKTGDYVNVEFDLAAKYYARSTAADLTKEKLQSSGF
ncbi:MAG: riboflavin synthase [Candidatus Omnitrophica bacterium]|nr:riboflavin synthase [Candidatus Omnitrophota bacterium]